MKRKYYSHSHRRFPFLCESCQTFPSKIQFLSRFFIVYTLEYWDWLADYYRKQTRGRSQASLGQTVLTFPPGDLWSLAYLLPFMNFETRRYHQDLNWHFFAQFFQIFAIPHPSLVLNCFCQNARCFTTYCKYLTIALPRILISSGHMPSDRSASACGHWARRGRLGTEDSFQQLCGVWVWARVVCGGAMWWKHIVWWSVDTR